MRKRHQTALKTSFETRWKAYKHAWKQNELPSISRGPNTAFGGWGATSVDDLDILWIMGTNNEFHGTVEMVAEPASYEVCEGGGRLVRE